MSELTIYKAAAGSGKTYTLTEEYLKIIFQNIHSYRNILAVTFTNKAANEMKTRILKEVNLIANGKESPHIEKIIEFTSKTEKQIIADAKEIQNYLLHDYSFFSVKTIDSFFQEILKSFTKEIGIQMGFQLELDSAEIIDKAIEKVILSIENNKEIKQWFLKMILQILVKKYSKKNLS
jgi:ATP-dependent exoDNAse (exonuclease V) beta subunit